MPSKSSRILLITALAASLCSGQHQAQDIAMEELQKLPVMELDRKNEFQAQVGEPPYGAPIAATEDAETGDVRVSLAGAGESSAALKLSLAPDSYRMVTITGNADGGDDGELSFVWRSDDEGMGDEARILIDSREKGVAGAVIQAGNHQADPFYGVPIHLSDVAKDQRTKSSPIRIVASQKARIEIYGLDGTPLAVDGTGNEPLHDAGDELFSETDGAGNLLLGLKDGTAALRIIAYPADQIGKDGLALDVEVLDGGTWILHPRNKTEP